MYHRDSLPFGALRVFRLLFAGLTGAVFRSRVRASSNVKGCNETGSSRFSIVRTLLCIAATIIVCVVAGSAGFSLGNVKIRTHDELRLIPSNAEEKTTIFSEYIKEFIGPFDSEVRGTFTRHPVVKSANAQCVADFFVSQPQASGYLRGGVSGNFDGGMGKFCIVLRLFYRWYARNILKMQKFCVGLRTRDMKSLRIYPEIFSGCMSAVMYPKANSGTPLQWHKIGDFVISATDPNVSALGNVHSVSYLINSIRSGYRQSQSGYGRQHRPEAFRALWPPPIEGLPYPFAEMPRPPKAVQWLILIVAIACGCLVARAADEGRVGYAFLFILISFALGYYWFCLICAPI